MTDDTKCPHCKRLFTAPESIGQHIRAKHPGKKYTHLLPRRQKKPREDAYASDSMADVFLQAELDRAMGNDVPDWVSEMMP